MAINIFSNRWRFPGFTGWEKYNDDIQAFFYFRPTGRRTDPPSAKIQFEQNTEAGTSQRKEPSIVANDTGVFTDETKSSIRLWIGSFSGQNPQSVVKFGSAYYRQVRTRTKNQAHYSREYFDNDRTEVFQLKFTNDTVGAEAEGYAIEYAQSIGISVNDRSEKAGSFSRNPKRGDVGFTIEDPGVIYFVPTSYSSLQGFREDYTSYYHKRQNYSADEIDENGRKIPLTYETGRKQHLTYETGRKQH
eukprot:CAMPEP_0178530890 /NCGR_PEP_ID=MMETSP0696-20121128/33132_1 /TAXON_ID=265572 /ORGANISM="Extubocellulus spinifer, Strain CCMP396" /LENGTH=245 /DNA_ID=CAMNT_0020162751 /DNA_START=575 /DNA_END=1310 /DNA_ORIENTATION=-